MIGGGDYKTKTIHFKFFILKSILQIYTVQMEVVQ